MKSFGSSFAAEAGNRDSIGPHLLPVPSESETASLTFSASQDALEVMGVTHSLSESWIADLTDVTLVSEDTY